jgi:hypothetical protein
VRSSKNSKLSIRSVENQQIINKTELPINILKPLPMEFAAEVLLAEGLL